MIQAADCDGEATVDKDCGMVRPFVWVQLFDIKALFTTVVLVAVLASSGWDELILGSSLLWVSILIAAKLSAWRLERRNRPEKCKALKRESIRTCAP